MNGANTATTNSTPTSFTEAPEWSQNIALTRADILKKYDEFLAVHSNLQKIKGTQRYVELFNNGLVDKDLREKLKDKKISKNTLYRWTKDFKNKGLPGLLCAWNNGGCRIDPEVQRTIESLIWKNHLCTYQDILEDLQYLVLKEKIPSYSTIRIYAKKYKKENWAALVLEHEGQKGLRDRNMQVVLGRADENITRPNQRWELDTTVADIFTGKKIKDSVINTSDGKRCKIIGVEDTYSRMARFFVVEHETGLMVGKLIKDRILAWGHPEEIVIDNGKPYKNRRVLVFLRSLGVSVHICIPGNPVEKPFIERVFGTLSRKLFRRLPGYSGNSVQNRPNEIEIEYTKEELQEIIDRYVTNVYAETVHSSTGQRPRERMSPAGFRPKTVAERDLDILLMEKFERKVRQGHISYDNGKFFHPKLPEGEIVTIRVNDFEASELIVYYKSHYLCTAIDLSRKGKSPNKIREARKERTQELRTRIKANNALLKKHENPDSGVLSLIEHKEQSKPPEISRKPEILPFPETQNVSYTGNKSEEKQTETSQNIDDHEPEEKLIRNNQERYLDIRRRERSGEPLDDYDKRFLDEFLESDLYDLIGSFLDEELAKEAV